MSVGFKGSFGFPIAVGEKNSGVVLVSVELQELAPLKLPYGLLIAIEIFFKRCNSVRFEGHFNNSD